MNKCYDVCGYTFMPYVTSLSRQMRQTEDILITFPSHSRRAVKENIYFYLTSTSFSDYFVSLRFSHTQNEKEVDYPENKAGFI